MTRLDTIVVNTAGGLTGGDSIRVEATAQSDATLTITTQAAERCYRSAQGTAQVQTDLVVESGAKLMWLPQETILFDHAALERRLHCKLAGSAALLVVEPVIFGRSLMGETVNTLHFTDRIAIDREDEPIYRDTFTINGDAQAILTRRAITGGFRAQASVIYVAPDAAGRLAAVRPLLPKTGGASLLGPDLLCLRVLADDSYLLRRSLLPVLDLLTDNTLPRSWRL